MLVEVELLELDLARELVELLHLLVLGRLVLGEDGAEAAEVVVVLLQRHLA